MEVFIVLDGPPGPDAGRFVQLETHPGVSVVAGEWKRRADGFWRLGPFFTEPSPPAPDFSAGEMAQRIDRVNAACAELAREVAVRRRAYPRFVASGRLSQEKADQQLAVLEDAIALLRELSGVSR